MNDSQITLQITSGWRYPPTRPLKVTPLWMSDAVNMTAGETIKADFQIPEGVESTRVAFVLVRIDEDA